MAPIKLNENAGFIAQFCENNGLERPVSGDDIAIMRDSQMPDVKARQISIWNTPGVNWDMFR